MSTPPLPASDGHILGNIHIKYKSMEIFKFLIEKKKFIFKILFNNDILGFNINEENSTPLKEFALYKNYDELKKIDKFFCLFENIEEIYNSLKRLICSKNLKLIKEEKQMKIKIKNSLTDKYFYINIPIKEIDINKKVDNLFNYITSLNKKIDDLEKELKDSKNQNNKLKQKLNAYENKIIELENRFKERIEKIEEKLNISQDQNDPNITKKYSFYKDMFKNSQIIKTKEIDLIMSWFEEKKPNKFNLLLDSRIDGDKNNTFFEKCLNKSPTMIFVKTTDNLRFGGFTNALWPNNNFFNYSMHSTLFIHEGTFDNELKEDALEKMHSTIGQAIDIGKQNLSKYIAITHFSPRYIKTYPYKEEFGQNKILLTNDYLTFNLNELFLAYKYLQPFDEIISYIENNKKKKNIL